MITTGYVSDIEGGWEAWREFLRSSSVLHYDEAAHSIALKENCNFVYGGDVCDRGSGDIRILRDLMKLKKDHPDRVFFIIGNRDANKLRIPFCLHEKVLAFPAQAYWVAPANGAEDGAVLNRVGRLKWVLKYSMGAPLAFECRREELKELGRAHDDEAVVQSFLDLVTPGHPENLLLQYLENAHMAVVLEDTIYVHGAINDLHMGYIPPRLQADGRVLPHETESNLEEWTRGLNAFARDEVLHYKLQLQSYLARIGAADTHGAGFEGVRALLWDSVGSYEHPQPGARLAQCGMGVLPGNVENPGVVYNSYLNRGEPVPLGVKAAAWLRGSGINKVVVGHQPNGDAPFLMDQHGVQVVSADTSYSKGVLYRKADLFLSPIFTAFGSAAKSCDPEVFCTVPDFVRDELDPLVAANVLPSPTLPFSAQANTRNLLAMAEVCVRHPQAPLLFARTAGGGNSGHLSIHGRLAQGSSYSIALPASEGNLRLGKRTAQGWFVKAAGIMIGAQAFSLLAHSKGFDFKAKLVAETDLSKEVLE